VLFTVSGLTPQIITETLYHLTRKQQPAFVPTRIIVATTTTGATEVRNHLLGSQVGWFGRLCRDYELPPIQFTEQDIHLLPGPDGKQLADILSEEENQAAADAITEEIRALTADPACALHVSMAGGRKTLGFFAAYALSLYGRPQDRLSHVLVSAEYENKFGFFYPTRNSEPVRDRKGEVVKNSRGEPLDASLGKVMLASIPFVRMRDGLSEALRSGRATYSDAVAAVQRRLDPPSLILDLPRCRAVAGGVPVELRPQLMALYVWLARKRMAGVTFTKVAKERETLVLRRDAAEFLGEYRRLRSGDTEQTDKSLARGMELDYFSAVRTRLNDALQEALDVAAERYRIKRFGGRGQSEFRLDLPPESITIIEAEP
jgi:CRISPR-associated protein (TIGR02584 family)